MGVRAPADQERTARVQVTLLVGVTAASAVAVVALCAATGAWAVLLSGSAVPVAFAVAGALGARARPDHGGTRLLLALGAGHLAAAALEGWAGVWTGPTPIRWGMGAIGDGAYLAGFVALAALIATYPAGRPTSALQCVAVGVAIAGGTVVLLDEVLLHARLTLAAGVGADSIPAPPPLPLAATAPDLIVLALLPIPLAVVVLAIERRRRSEPERRAMGWAVLAGVIVAVMLAVSPVLDLLTPGLNDVLFPLVVGATPFLMLAGLLRYRLLEVDLYVARSLARAVVVVGVAGLAALAAGRLDGNGAAVAGAALTAGAALGGRPLIALLERLADRGVTGGRVRRDAVRRELALGWGGLRDGELAPHAADLLRATLDIAWVRITTAHSVALAGEPSGDAALTLPLATPTAEVGTLECGRRRGGWRPVDVDLVRQAAAPLALLLRDEVLTRALQEQILALEASRVRLVEAEDAARRRMERDLHDGVQQQIVALLARISLARAQSAPESPASGALMTAHALAVQALTDLRLLVSGIAPAVLGDRGLVAAVESRAALLPIDVVVDADPRLSDERLPPGIEGAAYFVIAEALANVMKHAGSDHARVVLAVLPEGFRVAVNDDGNGAADAEGSGLRGLRDRVEALGGRFVLHSVPGVGTSVLVDFPISTLALS